MKISKLKILTFDLTKNWHKKSSKLFKKLYGWKVVKKWKSWKWKKLMVVKMSKTRNCLTRKKYQNVFEKNPENTTFWCIRKIFYFTLQNSGEKSWLGEFLYELNKNHLTFNYLLFIIQKLDTLDYSLCFNISVFSKDFVFVLLRLR